METDWAMVQVASLPSNMMKSRLAFEESESPTLPRSVVTL